MGSITQSQSSDAAADADATAVEEEEGVEEEEEEEEEDADNVLGAAEEAVCFPLYKCAKKDGSASRGELRVR
jgi:hypothetical protein